MKIHTLEEARDKRIPLTIPEIMKLDYEGKGTDENQGLQLLRERPGDAEILQKLGEEDGSRKIIPYGWGHNAFLGYTTLGQLKRFAPTGFDLPFGPELKRPDCPRVLGSIGPGIEVEGATKGCGWRIEYLNEVKGRHGTEKELIELKIFLARLNFFVWDNTPKNLRSLPDGDETPIFVDPDVVFRPIDDEEKAIVAYYAKQDLPPYYWGERDDRRTWKQVQCFSQLNPDSPDYGVILGFVNGRELALMESVMGEKHKLVEAIGKEGMYVDDLPRDLNELLIEFREAHADKLKPRHQSRITRLSHLPSSNTPD